MIKERARKLIHSKHMVKGMVLASFMEALIVPIPLEALLVPAMQMNRNKIWLLATAALVGCLLGAMVGYGVGYALFEVLGPPLIDRLSSPEQYQQIQDHMADEGFWYVLFIGVSPVPFQIAMLAAGATAYPPALFLLATAIARSLRYFGLALLVCKFGNQAMQAFGRIKVPAVILLSAVVGLLWWVLS